MNWLITIVFMVCYSYQFLYIPISWFFRNKKLKKEVTLHHFAVMICARNEAAVIGDLLDSLKNQTYPQELMTVFVIADNCTDDGETARIAREHGAIVYERQSTTEVGKGFALEALRGHIAEDYPEGFDGYFVFDADNILTKNYVEEMNKTFSQGHDIVTSYRNSKNFGSSWVSAGNSLWFLRESRYLQHPRYILNTSCTVSGTGFLFSRKISDEVGAANWPYHLLTEDIEFSADQIIKKRKIAMCREAELFDEQPITFRQSWRQRMRWAKGYFQVFLRYGGKLAKRMFTGSFSAFDMIMNIAPAFILSFASIVIGLALAIWGAIIGDDIMIGVWSVLELLGWLNATLFIVGFITTITEWKKIHAKAWQKILYAFLFPVFMLTYIPISFAALFSRVTWKPIEHTQSKEKMEKTEGAEATDLFKM